MAGAEIVRVSELLASTGANEISAVAPCRADLAGGTLDIWPLYLFHPGAVSVNVALNILTACKITPQRGRGIRLIAHDLELKEEFASLDELLCARRYRHALAAYLVRFFQPQGGFVLETLSESPAGAGISGSSALMIATAAALARFTGREMHKEQLRILAQNIEAQLIGVPTGCQDYYPALYGGVNAIHLAPEGVHRERISVPPAELDQRFVLFYTGAPRQSGINNWEVFQQHINGDRRIQRNFTAIARIAQQMHQALAVRGWDTIAALMREEWKLRRANAPGITTPVIDRLVSVALHRGAHAAKVCGAGGGGCVIVLTERDGRHQVEQAVRDAGGQVLAFGVARQGLLVRPE